jgi:three-Cys-motif partner protein
MLCRALFGSFLRRPEKLFNEDFYERFVRRSGRGISQVENDERGKRKMKLVRLHMAPHTKAKHSILESYLKGWFPILSRWNGRILYLDAYAGSGIYDNEDPGSPIIALNVANTHTLQNVLNRAEKWFYFIEKDKDTFETLKSVIEDKFGKLDSNDHPSLLPSSFKVFPIHDDFNVGFKDTLNSLDSKGLTLAPTFAFVDPYEYTLDLNLLSRIISYPRCEVFFTFMVGFLSRFVFADKHLDTIVSTFGTSRDKIISIRNIPDESEREDEFGRLLVDIMKRNLPKGQPLYSLPFEMIDNHNRPLYRLVYFTKSEKGMQVMKEAMFDLGGSGAYRFSDFYFNPGQTSILDYSGEAQPWIAQAAAYLHKIMVYQDWKIEDFKRFVLLETPYLYRAKILKHLEDNGNLFVIAQDNRRPGTYPPGSILRFI